MSPRLLLQNQRGCSKSFDDGQVRADEIEAFERPRDPVILPRPTCQFCHLYVWQDGGWIELDRETHAHEGAAP